MKLKYRVGKKVGLIQFDVATNRDVINHGRIVARRLKWIDYAQGKFEYAVVYAVRLDSGEIVQCEHEELWTKVWKGEK